MSPILSLNGTLYAQDWLDIAVNVMQVQIVPQRPVVAPGRSLMEQVIYPAVLPEQPEAVHTNQLSLVLRQVGLLELLQRAQGNWLLSQDWQGTSKKVNNLDTVLQQPVQPRCSLQCIWHRVKQHLYGHTTAVAYMSNLPESGAVCCTVSFSVGFRCPVCLSSARKQTVARFL